MLVMQRHTLVVLPHRELIAEWTARRCIAETEGGARQVLSVEIAAVLDPTTNRDVTATPAELDDIETWILEDIEDDQQLETP